jgi:hypothetical protein
LQEKLYRLNPQWKMFWKKKKIEIVSSLICFFS